MLIKLCLWIQKKTNKFLWIDKTFRPQTSRSLSAGAVDKSKRLNANEKVDINDKLDCLKVSTSKGNNITELEINSESAISVASAADNINTNITIIQVSTENTNVNDVTTTSSSDSDYEPPNLPHKTTTIAADVFKYPDSHVSVTKNIKQHEYKSNVQIIPSSSNNSRSSNANHISSSTIQVVGDSTTMFGGNNHYTTPVKQQQNISSEVGSTTTTTTDELSKITTVHVAGSDNIYGTCFTPLSSASTTQTSTPKMQKRIILSANTSGVTSITVNNTTTERTESLGAKNSCSGKIENDFNTTFTSTATTATTTMNLHNRSNPLHYEKVFLTTSSSAIASDNIGCVQPTSSSSLNTSPMSPKWNSPRHRQSRQRIKDENPIESPLLSTRVEKKVKAQNTKVNSVEQNRKSPSQTTQQQIVEQSISLNNQSSPSNGRRFVSPTTSRPTQPPRPPFLLTRGLTEAAITSRPSRKDFYFLNKLSVAKTKSSQLSASSNCHSRSNTSNNNENSSSASTSLTTSQVPITTQLGINRTSSEALEQRRRSSSTSDAQSQRLSRGTNNNDPSVRINSGTSGGGQLRQPPQPFRLTENILGVSSSPGNITPHNTTSPSKRMTLREQQVMQLRREIMHPGGVRLQLRRKDCVGSIAWVDAFGAIW